MSFNFTSAYWQTSRDPSELPRLQAEFVELYRGSRIPMTVILPCLAWVLHDYFVTLEDEIRYVWTQKPSTGRTMFFFIRYYTIMLLIFDVVQIHSFAIKGVPSKRLCVIIDPIVRLVGAISLWAVEIVMQLRIYAMYNCSKKIAWFNGIFFVLSVVLFIIFMGMGSVRRGGMINHAMIFPLPGCPTINGGPQWTLWVPATVFEINLFAFVLYKTIIDAPKQPRINNRVPLLHLVLQDNILYFLGVTIVLVLNNLMTIRQTGIPWFSFGPFHASLGIMTCRMHIHLRKATAVEYPEEEGQVLSFVQWPRDLEFAHGLDEERRDSDSITDEESGLGAV